MKLSFKLYLIIILLLIYVKQSAQSNFSDSLKLALKNANHDTLKCEILSELIENENDDSVWLRLQILT
jgi:hypothetical protein